MDSNFHLRHILTLWTVLFMPRVRFFIDTLSSMGNSTILMVLDPTTMADQNNLDSPHDHSQHSSHKYQRICFEKRYVLEKSVGILWIFASSSGSNNGLQLLPRALNSGFECIFAYLPDHFCRCSR